MYSTGQNGLFAPLILGLLNYATIFLEHKSRLTVFCCTIEPALMLTSRDQQGSSRSLGQGAPANSFTQSKATSLNAAGNTKSCTPITFLSSVTARFKALYSVVK